MYKRNKTAYTNLKQQKQIIANCGACYFGWDQLLAMQINRC